MSLSWQHCTHLYYSPLSLCLTAAAHVTHLSTRTHTYRSIWTTANQRGVRPSLSLIGLDHDISLTGVSFVEPQSFWVADTFFSFLEWLDAPVRPGIFVSRTREKLGRTCDQIGRTLEPWYIYCCYYKPRDHHNFFSVVLSLLGDNWLNKLSQSSNTQYDFIS